MMEPMEQNWEREQSPGRMFEGILAHERFEPPELPPVEELQQWQQRERQRIQERLNWRPGDFDPDPRVVEVEETADLRREKVEFNTAPWSRVPAYLLIPKHVTLPAPGMLCLHDHGGMYYWGKEKVVATEHDRNPVLADFKRTYYGGRSIANELAHRGYVVLVIDQYHWGERAIFRQSDPEHWKARPIDLPANEVLEYNRLTGGRLEVTARALTAMGTTWLGMLVGDDIRALDYLASREEVDATRLGCAGLSMGGYRAAWLSALDPRIKAAVIVGWMCRLRDCLAQTVNTIGHMKGAAGVTDRWDIPDLMALRVPKPTLVLQCARDDLFPLEGMERAVTRIREIYGHYGAETFEGRFYDVPHCFNAAMQEEAWKWLRGAV